MSKKAIEYEAIMSVGDLACYLEALLASLKEGRIVVERTGEYVVLEAGEKVKVEIEAKQKKGKSKFSLELAWKEEMKEATAAGDFKISSVAPEPVVVDFNASPAEGEVQAEEGAEEAKQAEDDRVEDLRHGE